MKVLAANMSMKFISFCLDLNQPSPIQVFENFYVAFVAFVMRSSFNCKIVSVMLCTRNFCIVRVYETGLYKSCCTRGYLVFLSYF